MESKTLLAFFEVYCYIHDFGFHKKQLQEMATNLYKTGFRRLLKSARLAFANDRQAILMARSQLRQEFYKNMGEKDDTKLVQLAKDVDDIEEMLRFNIVQGSLNKKGNFCKS